MPPETSLTLPIGVAGQIREDEPPGVPLKEKYRVLRGGFRDTSSVEEDPP